MIYHGDENWEIKHWNWFITVMERRKNILLYICNLSVVLYEANQGRGSLWLQYERMPCGYCGFCLFGGFFVEMAHLSRGTIPPYSDCHLQSALISSQPIIIYLPRGTPGPTPSPPTSLFFFQIFFIYYISDSFATWYTTPSYCTIFLSLAN